MSIATAFEYLAAVRFAVVDHLGAIGGSLTCPPANFISFALVFDLFVAAV